MEASKDISRLIEIMAALRTPVTGCPWDLEQNFATIKPYTIEEAYEVGDAIERNDMDDLCEEPGRSAAAGRVPCPHGRGSRRIRLWRRGAGDHQKMIRRHPHVFAVSDATTPDAVKLQWDDIKTEEKRERAERRARRGITEDFKAGYLGSVHRAQPALTEALKLQQRAAKVGFDWSEAEPILDKIEEEVGELREALRGGNHSKISDELGDLIFALVNIGRHVKADPEEALRGTNTKFRRRFNYIETSLEKSSQTLEEATLERMEELWQAAKAIEREIG